MGSWSEQGPSSKGAQLSLNATTTCLGHSGSVGRVVEGKSESPCEMQREVEVSSEFTVRFGIDASVRARAGLSSAGRPPPRSSPIFHHWSLPRESPAGTGTEGGCRTAPYHHPPTHSTSWVCSIASSQSQVRNVDFSCN